MRTVIFVGLLACNKSPTAQVKTTPAYDLLTNQYHSYVLSSYADTFFEIAIDYEKELAVALQENEFTPAERQQLQKIQQHVRSIIAYAVYSRCFKRAPRLPLPARQGLSQAAYNRQVNTVNWHNTKQHAESDWRARYDYNYHQRGAKDYHYQLTIDNERLCYVFLNKLRELSIEQIDLSLSHAEFLQKVMDSKVKSLNTNEVHTAQQNFFRHQLAPQIVKVTAQSMARADNMFPFHRQDWAKACEAYRDYYFPSEDGDRMYRFPAAVRAKINCAELKQLPQVTLKTHTKVDCAASPKSVWEKLQAKKESISTQPFTTAEALWAEMDATIQGMNMARAELDRLVKLRELDKIKSAQAGKDIHYTPYTEKKPYILPFFKVLHATKIDNPLIIKAIDTYHCNLVEANKRGVLPVIFASATQQEVGSVHLNHMGRFFGFGKVEYKPLQSPTQQTIIKAVRELKRELLVNWVEMQVAQADTQQIAERKIYTTMLNNEIAVAQLLLQNPVHTVVVTELLRKFQHDPITPKWLRTFKKFALGADLAFIPIAILGGFVTGGAGIVPILLMANAVNFLWIGAATAEQIVARNRYRMIERALLTGNSEQITRGMQVLRVLHEKRRDLIVSGSIGTTFSLLNLSLIAKGLDNLATVPLDVAAAISADVETLSMPDDSVSDADLHQEAK